MAGFAKLVERAGVAAKIPFTRPRTCRRCAARISSAMLVRDMRARLGKWRYHLAIPELRPSPGGKVGKPMDERIEAFLRDVLVLEGEISKPLREGVRRQLAICEKQFRDAETNKRMKDRAAQACRTLCRMRVAKEIRRRKRTSTAEHLKIVLSIIDSAALFPLDDE